MPDLIIPPGDAGTRVDGLVRKLFPQVPLSAIFKWIRTGKVRVNGNRIKPGHKLADGDRLSLMVPDEQIRMIASSTEKDDRPDGTMSCSEPLPPIIHQDDVMLVIDKPSGLAVHGGTGISSNHLTNRVRKYLAAQTSAEPVSLTYAPSPVHRLDRETSGIIVFARDARAHRIMCEDIRHRRWKKTYFGLVEGSLVGEEGMLSFPLPRKRNDPGPDEKTREAFSRYQVIKRSGPLVFLECEPVTGRFRQIRRHLAMAGLHLVGETRYGNKQPETIIRSPRLFLHAGNLELLHPVSRAPLVLRSALPPDLQAILRQTGFLTSV